MNHPLLQMIIARLRESYREPQVIFWVYAFPLLLAIALGIAFMNRKPEPQPVDVERVTAHDEEKLVEVLNTAGLKAEVHDEAECAHRLRTGKTVLYIKPTADGYRYVFDETRSDSEVAYAKVDDAILRWKTGASIAWKTEDDRITEPGNRYIDFLLPGLIGMNLLGGGLWGVGFAIADMRVRKLMKRLLATPMRRSHYLFAVLAARLLLAAPEMVLLLAFGWIISVPVRGGYATVLLFMVIGGLAFAGLGLLIASRSEKTETVAGFINLVMLPSWLFCGFFFSSKRFPDAAQPFIQALPATQLNDALREVMLEGASLAQVGWRLAILVAWAVVTFVIALRIFRWH